QGIDPRVMNLANQIKAAQGPEIQQMQGWLSQWGQPTMPMMPGMMPNGTMMPSGTMMPGPGMAPGEGTPTPPGDTHHTTAPSETSAPSPSTPAMPGPGGMPGMGPMPGLMSEQDRAAWQTARGVDASRLFWTQMISHHQGATTMAQQKIDSGQSPPAVALAHSIATSQQQEINTMQGLLGSL